MSEDSERAAGYGRFLEAVDQGQAFDISTIRALTRPELILEAWRRPVLSKETGEIVYEIEQEDAEMDEVNRMLHDPVMHTSILSRKDARWMRDEYRLLVAKYRAKTGRRNYNPLKTQAWLLTLDCMVRDNLNAHRATVATERRVRAQVETSEPKKKKGWFRR